MWAEKELISARVVKTSKSTIPSQGLSSSPLFNTELSTEYLEDGYQQAYQNCFEGKAPQTIVVSN